MLNRCDSPFVIAALVIPYATYSNAGFCLKPMDAFVEAARKAKLAA